MIAVFNNRFFLFIVCLGFFSLQYNNLMQPTKILPQQVAGACVCFSGLCQCTEWWGIAGGLTLSPKLNTGPYHIHTKVFSPPITLHTAKVISAGIQLLLISLAVDWIIYSPGNTKLWGCYTQLEKQGEEPWALVNSAASSSLGKQLLGTFWLNPCSGQAAQ